MSTHRHCGVTFCTATRRHMKPCSQPHGAHLPANGLSRIPSPCLPRWHTVTGASRPSKRVGRCPVSNLIVRLLLSQCLGGLLPCGTETRQSSRSGDFCSESSNPSSLPAGLLAPTTERTFGISRCSFPRGWCLRTWGEAPRVLFPLVCLSESGRKINYRPKVPAEACASDPRRRSRGNLPLCPGSDDKLVPVYSSAQLFCPEHTHHCANFL